MEASFGDAESFPTQSVPKLNYEGFPFLQKDNDLINLLVGRPALATPLQRIRVLV